MVHLTTECAHTNNHLDAEPQLATPYADAIRAYAARPYVRLDVPGHAAQPQAQPELAAVFGEDVLRLDLPPLLDGIDQGPAPTPKLQSAALAAAAWGAHRTWLLTNGGSNGNLVACLALRQLGTKIVVQRSMHSSVMDGMLLGGLEGHFVQPEVDAELGAAHGLTPEALAAGFDACPDAVAGYVVSPSYFGAVADIRSLAQVAHDRGRLLVVDAAWGAHFGFHPGLPESPLAAGADLVIMSTHKLAGSLTQTALLHLVDGPRAAELEPLISRTFRSMQSTSASALLMMSVDLVRSGLAVHGRERISRSLDAAARLRHGVIDGGRFDELSARIRTSPDVVDFDPLRVVIDTRVGGISGHEARSILFHDHDVHFEMATDSAIVAVIGAGSVPDVDRVLTALHALPGRAAGASAPITLPAPGPAVMTLRDAYFAPSELVDVDQAVGRVSAEALAAYPPGIPNLLPGELITADTIEFLTRTARSPFGHVRGAHDHNLTKIHVIRR
jgi:lysine decarboxylase